MININVENKDFGPVADVYDAMGEWKNKNKRHEVKDHFEIENKCEN